MPSKVTNINENSERHRDYDKRVLMAITRLFDMGGSEQLIILDKLKSLDFTRDAFRYK